MEPTEDAWEILEEAVAPFTREVERLLALGFEDAARAQCEGVLLGLDLLHDELFEWVQMVERVQRRAGRARPSGE